MLEAIRVEMWEGRLTKNHWIDRFIGTIPISRRDEIIQQKTRLYINQLTQFTLKDKVTRRLMMKVSYSGNHYTFPKVYLIVRTVYNNGREPYQQLSGTYHHGNWNIPVIGNAILNGQFRIGED